MGFRLSGGVASLLAYRRTSPATTTSELAMSAYLQSLQKEQTRAQRLAPVTLQQRIQDWFNALPELTRQRPFSMGEIAAATESQGRHIGPVLLALGWTRMRTWSGNHPYRRYWLPPNLCRERHTARTLEVNWPGPSAQRIVK